MPPELDGALGANIQNHDTGLPKFCYGSEFFRYADITERSTAEILKVIKVRRFAHSFIEQAGLREFRGTYTHGHVYAAKIPLPIGYGEAEVYIPDTPENNSMTIGRITPEGEFQLPRFHTGVAAQDDMQRAMWQAAQIPAVQEIFSTLAPAEGFGIKITREGHLIDAQRALYYSTGINFPFTLAHVEHAKDPRPNNPFGRIAKISPLNLEGMAFDRCRVLVIGDNIAAGAQVVPLLEQVFSIVKSETSGRSRIKRIVIFSPFLSYFGLITIASWAKETHGVASTFIGSGAILGCNPPDRYFCPVLANENLAADPRLIAINHKAHGPKAAGRACARCNWTSSLLAPKYALDRSGEELALYGTSNREVRAYSSEITFSLIKEMGIDPLKSLIPISALRELSRRGSLVDFLKKVN